MGQSYVYSNPIQHNFSCFGTRIPPQEPAAAERQHNIPFRQPLRRIIQVERIITGLRSGRKLHAMMGRLDN